MILSVLRLLVLATIGFGLSTSFAAQRAQHVFIVSIDGGAPAVMKAAAMPTLQRLAAEGAVSWTAQTIRPPITLPSHTSMTTGVLMETHKVSWNDWRPANGIVQTPTIFATAKQAGLTTAMFAGKEKFKHLVQSNSLDQFSYDSANSVVYLKSESGGPEIRKTGVVFAQLVATNAADYIIRHTPNLCLIHLADADTVGHQFGWGSPEQIKTFANVDAGLKTVVEAIQTAGLQQKSVVIISADHGGQGKDHNRPIAENLTIPWIAWGQGVKAGQVLTNDINTCDTAATALWLLDVKAPVPMDGKPVTGAFE
jgi:predicted AlkP superfamily pyrophosphatase or phosphodiesterase